MLAIGAIVAAILVVGLVAGKATSDNQSAMLDVISTRIALQRVYTAFIEQQDALRGYVAVRDARLLAPYYMYRSQIPGFLDALEKGASPSVHARVDGMEDAYGQWRAAVAEPLVAAPGRKDSGALLLGGQALSDRIRDEAIGIRIGLDAALAESVRSNRRIGWIEIGSVIVLVILFGLALLTFARERIGVEVRLREALASRNAALERSNTYLEEFAYAASHDLQEPLRAIAGFTRLLKQRYADRLDEEGNEFVDFIEDGASRMSTLIDDVLQYSRTAVHGEALEDVDLSAVVERAAQNLHAPIAASGARIDISALPHVEGDSTQLLRLMQNLIGNALKYNRREPPRVWISAEHGEDGDWIVSVRDNGIGIAPKYQERIFRIFARLHTREEYGGSGIGLALCRRIVELHGGRIWVHSVEGEGATFSFTLRPVSAKGVA